MALKFNIYAADGTLQLSLADTTTRTVGVYVVTGPNPPLPTTTAVSGIGWSYYIDFPCPTNTAPTLYIMGNNRAYAVGEVNRLNSTTARLTFNLGYNGTYPAGETVTLYYGWGAP